MQSVVGKPVNLTISSNKHFLTAIASFVCICMSSCVVTKQPVSVGDIDAVQDGVHLYSVLRTVSATLQYIKISVKDQIAEKRRQIMTSLAFDIPQHLCQIKIWTLKDWYTLH